MVSTGMNWKKGQQWSGQPTLEIGVLVVTGQSSQQPLVSPCS